MVEFCPECSSLLRKQIINGEYYLACKCGYQKEQEKSKKELKTSIQKKKKALEKNLVILSEDDKISVYPKVNRDCPRCGYSEAETWQRQIRGADEPMTHFFRCVKCKYTWREQ
ncbi:MAG: transcription factor S [Promethearchaeota archaeon]